MPVDTYPENTAFLLGHGNGYSAEHFQALRKIRVTGGDHEILATLALALADDEAIIGHGEIGLGEQAFRRLGLPEGAEGYPVSQSFLPVEQHGKVPRTKRWCARATLPSDQAGKRACISFDSTLSRISPS